MKKILILTAMFAALCTTAQARTIQDYQNEMGIDKIAHASAGAVCSLYMAERVLEGKKNRKLLTAAVCSALAFMKERSDTKSDPKDFLATGVGVLIPLIEFKIEF